MHEVKRLRDKLCHELDEYAKVDKLDMPTLQTIDTIAHSVKNLNKILDREDKTEYSEGPRVHGTYSFGDRNMGDWRLDDRYAMGSRSMINRLYDMMNEARDEKVRHEFQKFIDRMERM